MNANTTSQKQPTALKLLNARRYYEAQAILQDAAPKCPWELMDDAEKRAWVWQAETNNPKASKVRRIVINNLAGISDAAALMLVAGVVAKGMVSRTGRRKHYSHATLFGSTAIWAGITRSGTDVFNIEQTKAKVTAQQQ